MASSHDCDIVLLTLVSPVSVPGVGYNPVRSFLLHAPAKDTDGMASQHGATSVLVHACKGQRLDDGEGKEYSRRREEESPSGREGEGD